MSFKYTGDALLGVSLNVETNKPLDIRTVVDSIEDLYTIPEQYAYEGMTVANIANGNIYMLIDKAHIGDKTGWKASYESIQIIACTQEEYEQLKQNTTEDFKPVDGDLGYIHPDTYYYIYEDSLDENQFYLSAEWGKNIEEQLNKKATSESVTSLRNQLNSSIEEINTNLESNYTNTETLQQNYYDKDTTDSTFATKEEVSNTYATKENVQQIEQNLEENYVTKEDLKGDSPEDDDFIFVTQTKYNQDKEANAQNFQTQELNTQKINLGESVVTSSESKLYNNEKELAHSEDVPKIVCVTQEEYEDLVENEQTEPETYYYTYGKTSLIDTGYVTPDYLKQGYYTKSEVQELIKKAIDEAVSIVISQLGFIDFDGIVEDEIATLQQCVINNELLERN